MAERGPRRVVACGEQGARVRERRARRSGPRLSLDDHDELDLEPMLRRLEELRTAREALARERARIDADRLDADVATTQHLVAVAVAASQLGGRAFDRAARMLGI